MHDYIPKIYMTILPDILLLYLNQIIDKKLTRIWMSFGNIFLEIGELEDGEGEYTFMIPPSYRFQNKDSIICSNHSSINQITNLTSSYINQKVKKVEILDQIWDNIIQEI